MDQPTSLNVTPEVAERILANMRVWLKGTPENDDEWLAMMTAIGEIRADFEALLAENEG